MLKKAPSRSEALMARVVAALRRARPGCGVRAVARAVNGVWHASLHVYPTQADSADPGVCVCAGAGRTRALAWSSCVRDYCYCYSSQVPAFLKAATRAELELRLAMYGGEEAGE